MNLIIYDKIIDKIYNRKGNNYGFKRINITVFIEM